MPQLDFYILSDPEPWSFVCKLVNKVYQQQQFLYIYIIDQKTLEFVDQQLWTFQDISFIPHQIFNTQTASATLASTPILLGDIPPPLTHQQNLLNLSSTPPPFIDVCERILECVCNDPTRKQQSRELYRYYQQQGLTVKTHQL